MDFGLSQIELGQVEGLTDGVAMVGMEEEGHASGAQIAVTIFGPCGSVDLGISPKISHPLDVHYNQLMARPLKCEVAECLK